MTQIRYYYDPLSNMMKQYIVNIKDIKMTKTDNAQEILEESYITRSSIYNGPYTKTALFLLPMLDGLNLRHSYINKYLYNAYLDDIGYSEVDLSNVYVRPIFLLLKTKSFIEKEFKALEELLRDMKEYRMEYDIGVQNGDRLIMYVFETAEKYKKDYYHFKSGRYSQFSKEYKAKFPKETTLTNKKTVESLMYGVIHKTSYRKDEVAKHFCVKDVDGKIKDPEDYTKFRNNLEDNDEIWDSPKKEEEYYRYKS